jgi:hypothetical protein
VEGLGFDTAPRLCPFGQFWLALHAHRRTDL